MKFERSQIPIEVQEQEPALLDKCEAEILVRLSSVDFRHALSLHEGAHATYRRRVGAPMIIFVSPRLYWDEKENGIIKSYGGIDSQWARIPDLSDIARCAVAGDVWERALAGTRYLEGGSVLDRLGFEESYLRVCPNATKDEIENCWSISKADVEADLGNSRIEGWVREWATAYGGWLQSWLVPHLVGTQKEEQ